MLYKIICRYGEPGVGINTFRQKMTKFKIAYIGFDFNNSPYSEILLCEMTFVNNDVRLELTWANKSGSFIQVTNDNVTVM